mgnify:CR=1 FL=1
MAVVEIRKSEWSDANALAPKLRKADKEEMIAVLGEKVDPVAALRYGIGVSYYPFTGLINGEIVCIFGAVAETHDHIGAVWLMGSDDITRHKMAFLRQSRVCLGRLFEPFALLWNCVDKRNTQHIRWLKWLGFSFLREIPEYGEQSRPFLEFAKIKE